VTWDDDADAHRFVALRKDPTPEAIAELAAMSKLGADKTRVAARSALERLAPKTLAILLKVIRGAVPSTDASLTKKLRELEAAKFPALPVFVAVLAERGVPAPSYACELDDETCKRVLATMIEDGRLDLSGVKSLPDVLAELPVTSLRAAHCGLVDVPACVLAMSRLERLDLSRNRLRRLGDDVRKLRSLREIRFVDGPLASLDNFDQLAELRELSMYRTHIKDVPASFAALTKLETLRIVQCKKLKAIPTVIPTMQSLRHLEIDHTGVTAVDPAIWGMSQLHHLDLSGTELGDVPAAIGNLTEIRELLRGAKLRSLPDEIGNCHKLETLDLVLNHQLGDLPEGFYRLKSLRRLRIEYTAMESTQDKIRERLPEVEIYK
jgi:Leucine-rich repeat (LRR) protein